MASEGLIGVDIGGTTISAGLVLDERLHAKVQTQNPAKESVAVIKQVLVDTIGQVFNKDIKGIGIGIPGLVDAENGIVHNIKNIPALSGYPLAQSLSEHFGKPVFLNNDANCYAVGEKYFGAGKAADNLVAFTLGTGLGAGLILEGHLYNGTVGGAGEFGTLKYLDKNLEYYCSSEFFKSRYDTNSLALSERADRGDKEALRIFNEYGGHIGDAIGFAMSIVNPELVVLGGSIALAYTHFCKGMKDVLKAYPLKRISAGTRVVPGALSESAVLGAAALYHDKMITE